MWFIGADEGGGIKSIDVSFWDSPSAFKTFLVFFFYHHAFIDSVLPSRGRIPRQQSTYFRQTILTPPVFSNLVIFLAWSRSRESVLLVRHHVNLECGEACRAGIFNP